MISVTPSIQELLDNYLDNYADHVSMKGTGVALSNVKTLTAFFGDMLFDRVKVLHIVKYINERKKSVSGNSIRRELSVLRSAIQQGIKYELIPTNGLPISSDKCNRANNKRGRKWRRRGMTGAITRRRLLTGKNRRFTKLCEAAVTAACRAGELS